LELEKEDKIKRIAVAKVVTKPSKNAAKIQKLNQDL
jgi:hypothetical protein